MKHSPYFQAGFGIMVRPCVLNLSGHNDKESFIRGH